MDAKCVQWEFIDGRKTAGNRISCINEYLLLANVMRLNPDEVKVLPETV